jgi:hypothetical protein
MVEYLLSAYRDPMFLMFPIYTTILGVFLYLLFALPLSAVAYLDPVWARKYASFEFRVGVLPGQARAQARRSERLTRVGEVS